MSDDRRDDRRTPATVPPTRDPRRTTSRTEVERAQSQRHDTPSPLTLARLEVELTAHRNRLMTEVREELAGQRAGIEEHVRRTVKAELAPYLGQLQKLDVVLVAIEAMRTDALNYRSQREGRDHALAEANMQVNQTLEIAAKLAGIEGERTKAQESRTESARRYRVALITVLATIFTALAGLAGAAIASHHGGL